MAIPVFDLKPFISNQLIKIKVIPNASSTKLVEETGHLKLYLKAVPEKDKANKELIKFQDILVKVEETKALVQATKDTIDSILDN